MKLHTVPFEKRKVAKNLQKWIPLGKGEVFRIYLNPWILVPPNAGYVITSRRVIEFDKGNLVHNVSLKSIKSVKVEVQSDEYLTKCFLVIRAGATPMRIEFGSDEWHHLLDFVSYLESATGKKYNIRVDGLIPGREKLQAAARASLARTSIANNLSLQRDEQPVAYATNRIAAGTLEYVLTNRRLVEYTMVGIEWEVPLNDIKSFEYGAMGYLHVHTKRGKKHSLSVSDRYTYDVWISLIKDAQHGRLGKPKQTKQTTTARRVRITYPLRIYMSSRGWMEGFQYKVRGADDAIIYEAQCRDNQTLHVGSGEVTVSLIKPIVPGEHYTFEDANGSRFGGIRREKGGLLGSGHLAILDGRGTAVGAVRKKAGVKSWAQRTYVFDIGGDEMLEMHCAFQHPGRTMFEINCLQKPSTKHEKRLLKSAFALRLLEPDIMKDPVRSVVKDLRGDFSDAIEGLF